MANKPSRKQSTRKSLESYEDTPQKERRFKNNRPKLTHEEQFNIKLAKIKPITENQKITFEEYDAGQNLLLYGTAGTGKTFISMYLAMGEVLAGRGPYRKVVVVRSVVPTRDMGFLPGSAKEKSFVYEAPYNAICSELINRGDAYEILKRKGVVEFITSSFVRGITLRDCIVVVDEFQNMTFEEQNSIITRVGDNCKIIFCGDCKQNDLRREETGFNKFHKILSRMNSFSLIEFGIDDIVRSQMVKEYIITCEEYENRRYETKKIPLEPVEPDLEVN
jgi:phosphate starvation-inducible protein PhoH